MRVHSSFFLILSVVGTATGCGQKDAAPASGATEQLPSADTWSLAVQTEANLPACNQAGDGRLAFVKSTNQFMACSAGNWSQIDMKSILGSVPAGSSGGNGTNGVNGSDGKSALLKVVAEPRGSNCPSGGKKVLSGIDGNADSVLSDTEVTGTSFICNGADGADGLAIESTWKYHYSGALGSDSTAQLIGETEGFYLWLTNIELQKFTSGGAFATASGVKFSFTGNEDDVYDEHWSQSFFLAPSTQNQVVVRKFGVVANTLFQFQVTLSETPIFKSVITYQGSPITTVKTFSLTKQ